MKSESGMEQGGGGPAGEGYDPALAALRHEPFTLLRPCRQRVPFVFASPHSGRLYPPSFVARSRLGALGLRRSEDAFVDELFASAALGLGAPIIAARFPRAFLDANRGPGELDPDMFAGELALHVDLPGPRVQAGLGVIPRIVRDGAEIYRERLKAGEATERIDALFRPYHAALLSLVQETRSSFGFAVVIDCHSMPSAAAAPDVVLGDRYGTSAASLVSHRAQQAFESKAFTVARNVPYAGGYTTQLYGRPVRGIHALQIEISRGLYLDEERIIPGSRFDAVQLRIADALTQLASIGQEELGPRAPHTLPWAAE
jgi:N-formylglutamate deformylase